MSSDEAYTDEDFEDFDEEGEDLEYEEDEAEKEDEVDETEEADGEEVEEEIEETDETDDTKPAPSESIEELFEGQTNIIYEEHMKTKISSKRMTYYEMEELIGIRAKMIEDGDKVYVDIEGLKDPIKMAEKELYARRCPLKLKREIEQIGNTIYIEVWNVRDMDLPERQG